MKIIRRILHILVQKIGLRPFKGKGEISFRAITEGSMRKITIERGAKVSKFTLISTKPSGEVVIGENTVVQPFAKIRTLGGNIQIGKNCSIHSFCTLYGAGNIVMGDDIRMAANSAIIASNHSFSDVTKKIVDQPSTSQGIKIGNDVWIGNGVKILDGVIIGDHVVLAAGTIVTKNIPSYSLVMGIPGKVTRDLRSPHELA